VRWTVHGRRAVYESGWVNVYLDDVELPDGSHLEHHVLEMPRHSVGAVVVDDRDRTLLIWRHRFITDAWGWEVPAGWVDPGEDPDVAIRREIEEETGYRVDDITRMVNYNPLSGISTMSYTTYVGRAGELVRSVTDEAEATRVEWVPLTDIPGLASNGQIADGPSLLMLSYYLGVYRNPKAE
jgi:8-oxo-dGTP pyrophosphatase MutT (NUDIX family)